MKASQKFVRTVFLLLGAAIAMAVVAVGFANAGIENAGTTSANFLSVGAGPRILSMGGATIGLGSDLAAGSWNPAAIGWMDQSTLTLSHAGLENQSLQEWAAFGGRFGETGTRWSVTGLYQGDGSFEGRDASNNSTGSFSVSSFAVGAQLAQQLGSKVTLGAGLKTVMDNLGGVSGIGTTFDAGLMFRHGIVGAGVVAQNIGGHMDYQGAIYPFPSNYGVGVGLSHPGTGLSLAIDANFPYAYYSDVRTGIEWRWKQTVALRGGYRHEMGDAAGDPLTGPTFGLGAGLNGFWLDYGFLLAGQSDGEHRVALTFFPGKWGGLGTDPYGQGEIPTQFDSDRKISPKEFVGPPVPKKTRK